ncbi:hypothetical protein [Allobranchiibius sp. GilTou73]|uniref:hypothetical protein n=2 Tax=unclassified Allobranchiibius TaxID=2649857 RepID=UPI001F1FECE1|nr:hypothetical protein [Allobranchiibius sp. GilTou73]UIJ36403.1 hypothetical protein LVQ62_08610 [Allobranchiibius sp. GilTou73]
MPSQPSQPSPHSAPAPAQRAQPSPFDTMLRTAFLPSLGAGVVTAVVAWIVAGGRAGLSAAFGAALALIFFAAGLLVMRKVIDVNAVALMAAAMAVFFGQLILVLLVMLAATTVLDLQALPTMIGVVVVVLVWQIFQVLGFVRSRRPVYDPPSAGGEVT